MSPIVIAKTTAQLIPHLAQCAGEAAAGCDRPREIVVFLANFRTSLLQNPWNPPDLFRGLDRQKRRRGPAEIMKSHLLAEPAVNMQPRNGIESTG